MARIARGVITLTDIKDGDQGIAGARNAVRYLYKETITDTAPDAPQATITWSTGSLSSITTGWSEEPPVVDATGTGRPWVSTLTFHQASSSSQTATTTATGDTPKKGFTFDGVVTFSNNNLTDGSSTYDPATVVNSGTTTIDGGKITANSITSLGAVTAGTFSLGSGTFSVNASGQLNATDAIIDGNITANTLTLTDAQVENSRSSPSLILSSSQLDQSVINLIDTRIEGYGLASSGYFAEDTGGFNNTIPDHPVFENFTHLNGKNVVIELTASSTWTGIGSPTYPPLYPNDDSSLVIEIQRRVSTETDWTNAVVVDTITNGTSLDTVISGGTWSYGYSSVWFNGLTINYTFNDDPATGTYDYRAFIKTIGNNYIGVSTFYFEANEAGTASGGGVNDYVNSFSINDSTGLITVGRTGTLGDLTASISTYVGNQVSALVDSAPATLDTLNELAAALGDDANFAQTTTTALGTKWTQDNTKISKWDDAYEQQHSWEWKYITYNNSIQVVDNTEAEMLAWYKNYFINISEATLTSYPVQYEGHINTYDVDTSGTFGGSLGSHWTAEDTYHAHIYTNIYVEKPFTVTNSAFAGDDDHALFINGEFVSGSISTAQPSYTYSFKKGWYRIDLIFDEQAGGDYIQLGWNPKDYTSYISDMTPYRGGDNPIHLSDKINAVNNSSNWDTAYGWGDHSAAGYQLDTAPSAPSITSTSIVNETVEVVFSQSSTSGIEYYEIWSDGGTGSHSLIAKITEQDFASSMSVVDVTFSAGTVNYRVFAVKNGIYSAASTTSIAFTAPSLDVANLQVVPDLNVFHIGYNIPDSRFVDHVEIYADANASSSSLSRNNATIAYSGNGESFIYNISSSERDMFHQFWVEVV